MCCKIVHVIKPTYNRGSNMHFIIYSLFDDLDNCHIDHLLSEIMTYIHVLYGSLFQLGGPAPSGDSLGGLGDIFGMPTAQSYVPPQEVSVSS